MCVWCVREGSGTDSGEPQYVVSYPTGVEEKERG